MEFSGLRANERHAPVQDPVCLAEKELTTVAM